MGAKLSTDTRRKQRVRRQLRKVANGRPRLSVYRSAKHIYAQIIDDEAGRTLHHDIAGRHGAGKVELRAAPPGTGIIAGGPMRAVFEVLGMQDVVAKSVGSSNPYNMIHATFAALKKQGSPRSVAARRGKKVSDLISRRRDEAQDDVEVEAAS